ncbi:MAG: DUF4367 domain-containing protein, partial [Anaerolineae bacterium]
KGERIRAEQVSAAVDQLVADPKAQPELIDPVDAGVLATAQQLAQLPELLGPVDPALEQLVRRQFQAAGGPAKRAHRRRWAWAAAGLAIVLLVAVGLTPLGQTAVAGFMAVFNLGRAEVRATATAGGTAVQERLTLEEAQQQISFTIPQPAYLPTGYQLQGVDSYTYPDLPAWVPQPLFVELVYGDDQGEELNLRAYSIVLDDEVSISALNLQAQSIREATDVDVNGHPGVALRLGSEGARAVWHEVVWEQADLILSLSSVDLTEAELLRIARSVR